MALNERLTTTVTTTATDIDFNANGGAVLVDLNIASSWDGSVDFQATLDGSNYFNTRYTEMGTLTPAWSISQLTSLSTKRYYLPGPLTQVRISASAGTTGTLTVVYRTVSYGGDQVILIQEAVDNGLEVQGPVASDGAIAGNPLPQGLHVDETAPAAVGEGDIRYARGSAEGDTMVQPAFEGANIADANGIFAQGKDAEDAAVTQNPQLMAGRYETTQRSLDAGDVGAIAVGVDGRIETALLGLVSRTSDQAANDSDKSFPVPAGKQWLVMGIYADFRPTGTAGNRRLQVQIDDGSDVIWRTYPDNLIPATNRFDMAWGPGFPLATATQTGVRAQYAPLPEFWLDAGWNLQILDAASVDGAADDLRLGLFYLERDSA